METAVTMLHNQIPLWCQPEFDVWTLANISMSCSCRPDNVKLTSIWISAAITRIARIIIIVSIFIYFRHATKSIEPAVFPWQCPRSSGKGRVTSENLPNKVRHCNNAILLINNNKQSKQLYQNRLKVRRFTQSIFRWRYKRKTRYIAEDTEDSREVRRSVDAVMELESSNVTTVMTLPLKLQRPNSRSRSKWQTLDISGLFAGVGSQKWK